MTAIEATRGIIGIVLTLASLAVALWQTVRNKRLRDALERARRTRNADTWVNIGVVVRTFDSLEEARRLVCSRESVDHEVLSKIQSARRGTVDQYRQLLKDAVLQEPEYSLKIVRKWELMGRLENEWRKQQAIRLLATEDFPDPPVVDRTDDKTDRMSEP